MSSGIVNIRGKAYQTVAYRVQTFREKYALELSIETEIVERDDALVVMRAVIRDSAGRVLATGHAEELRTSSQINQTSALENAETSAIGRALAALGIGGTEYASANEVEGAVAQQESRASTPRPSAPTSGEHCDVCRSILDEKTSQSAKNPGRKYLSCPRCLDKQGKPGKFVRWADEAKRPPPIDDMEERQAEIAETSGAAPNRDMVAANAAIERAAAHLEKEFPRDPFSQGMVIQALFACATLEKAKESHGTLEVARALKDHLLPAIKDVKAEGKKKDPTAAFEEGA